MMVKIMRYFFDNEGIFLRAIARNTGRRGFVGVFFLRAVARNTGRGGCGGVFFYGLSPAIRDGGGVRACFFTGCRPQYGTEGCGGFFLRAVARNTGREGCEERFFMGCRLQ